jgi:hypothetical protein
MYRAGMGDVAEDSLAVKAEGAPVTGHDRKTCTVRSNFTFFPFDLWHHLLSPFRVSKVDGKVALLLTMGVRA